jgi:hypothetical protein
LNDPRLRRWSLLDFARSQVARLSKLTVNPLLNSAGRHAHEIRLRLADRNGIADLELPFPQPRLYLGKAEFNTPAVHLQTLRLVCNQAIQRRRKGLFKTEQFPGCTGRCPFSGKQAQLLTPHHRLTGEPASSNQPQAWFFQDWFFQDWFFRKMVRRAIVGDYLTISAHAAVVPYSTMY